MTIEVRRELNREAGLVLESFILTNGHEPYLRRIVAALTNKLIIEVLYPEKHVQWTNGLGLRYLVGRPDLIMPVPAWLRQV